MAEVQIENEKKFETGDKIEPPKEHGTLGYLLSQIPKKAQKGLLVQCDLIMTCVDANQDYIVIGTNIGILFLYDRKKTLMERLKTGSNSDVISCVSLHHGLEHQVAAGTTKGSIYIFQLPSLMPGQNKQLHKFEVANMHKSSLSCLTWSLNGMKLCSGDQKGHVVCTEVDFYQGQCKSAVLMIESNTDIVQLHHAHKSLLVSSRHRTVVCRIDDKDQLMQIGQKDRKIPGPFGGVFIPALCRTDDAQLYAARPGMRIWQAKIDGTVENTYLFKELINNPHPEIVILFCEGATPSKSSDVQFGCLLLYLDKYLITWNTSTLFILDPQNNSVIGSQNRLGTIVDVAVTKDEIFILRKNTDRNLIRIAAKPENADSVYEKLLQEKRLADAATNNLKSSDPALDEKSNTSSPFKFFQTNIVDKIKNLDVTKTTKTDSKSVMHLKESMDKFGHVDSDTGDEEELHHHGHHYNPGNVINDTPPAIKPASELKVDLPPIVTLDSPDLLTVELFSGIPSNISKVVQPMSPGSERFNPFMKENLSDCEDEKIHNIYDSDLMADISTKSDKVTTDRESNNRADLFKTEAEILDKPESIIPKPLVDRLTTDVLQKDDDIVFTDKPKHKRMKKKKGHKNKQKAEEEDKVSIVSTEEISLQSNSLQIDRESSKDSDSVSIKSDVSDASSEIQLSTPERTSGKISPLHSNTENKKRQKQKDVFSRIEENLENLEGFEKHLAHLPQNRSINNTSDSYLKNFENRAGIHLHSNFDDSKSEVEQPKSPISYNESEQTESTKLTSSEKNDDLNTVDLRRLVADCKTSLSPGEDTPVNKVGKTESEEENSVKLHTERSLSVEDSIYSKQISVDESEATQYNKDTSDAQPSLQTTNVASQESDRNTQKQTDPCYKTPDSSLDDIYNKFGSASSNLSSIEDEHPLQTSKQTREDNSLSESDSKTDAIIESTVAPSYKLVNNWTEILTAGNLLSCALSNSHIWFTDKSCNIYFSALSGTGIKWQKASVYAKQIAVSRSGYIVWKLYKDTVHAGTKITTKRPEGFKWVEAVREVQYIDVDEHCAWYIKTNGDIMVQRGLSKDRPCYKGIKVPCQYTLKQIICQSGVVWGLTDQCSLIYRSGITKSCPEGKEWSPLQGEDLLFSCITFGSGNVAWAIDVLGRICFTTNVTMETPTGDGKWWQVPRSEILVQDMTAVDALMSLAKKFDPQKLAYIMSTTRGGLISAGVGGVWVCPEFKNILQICRGYIEGHFWEEVNLSGISSSMVWKLISASSSDHQYGLIWTQQPNGDLFTFSPNSNKCNMVSRPPDRHTFVRLTSCRDSAWGLTENGSVYIRGGIGSFCPQGTDWSKLDITQLGDVHLIHLACGNQCVWAVDSDGIVYQRLGVKAPSSHSLPSVWLPVDSGQTVAVFTQVMAGTNDWMVWALDNRRQVYARFGITDTMPIGTEWVHVPGTPATQLTVSNSYVWALNPNGEILCRYGVTRDNPGGDYWRQIPGVFIQISTSSSDRLWGINREGRICQRHTKYLSQRQDSYDPLMSGSSRFKSAASISSDDGWELV